MKKVLILLVLLVVAGAVAGGWAKKRYSVSELDFDQAPVRIKIHNGDSLRKVGRRLRDAGVDMPDWAIQLIGRYRNDTHRIQAGTYELAPPLTMATLIDRLVKGDVANSKVLFVEGWQLRQMRQAILANKDITHDVSKLPEGQLLKKLGAKEKQAEGIFFPSTYSFAVGSSDLQIYQQAYQKMHSVLNDAWKNRAPDSPLKTPYEALILASVVEKETGIESDRAIIAGVFVNRLKIKMMLQSDPTTIYGLGDKFDGDLRKRDLITDTPYNTYTRKGLPPTPIALSSKASIQAVLNPAKTKALYFVARGDGSSQFSETLAEHEKAVRKYQLGGRAKARKKKAK